MDAGQDDLADGRPCRTCGFSPGHLDLSGAVSALDAIAEQWSQLFVGTTMTALARVRTAASSWSALERAAQVRDTLHVKAKRLERLRDYDHPNLEEADSDATRTGDNDLAPHVVVAAMATNAHRLLEVARSMPHDSWKAVGQRNGSWVSAERVFHEAIHLAVDNLHDARLIMASAALGPSRLASTAEGRHELSAR